MEPAVDHLTRLLLAARDGDLDALERFVVETQSDVWRLCRHLGDPEIADDLAQETYERAIGALHRFRADGTARSWLLTIARRTCADSARRRARRRRLDARLRDEPQLAPEAQRSLDGRVDLDALVDALDPDRRAAFVVTQQLGLRYDEAAELLSCPIGTIRSRVARARADLLAMLDATDATSIDGATDADPGAERRDAG